MTEPSELRGAITKEEAGEVAVVLSDEIYRLSSAAQMGYEQSDAEFFAPRAERLDLRAEYLRSIRSKLLAPSVPEPPNDAESECACQDMSQAFIGNHRSEEHTSELQSLRHL